MSISPLNCPDTSCYWAAFGIPDAYTEARAWHLAVHRAEEHSEPLTVELIAYAVSKGYTLPEAARAAQEPTADRLTSECEAGIAARVAAATKGPWGVYESGTMIDVAADLVETGCGYRARREIARFEDEPLDNDPAHREWTAEEDWAQVQADAEFVAHAREDVPALLAELAAVRTERDRYRSAWQSASFRAEARGEGILRITRDRETYQGWLKQEQDATQQLRARVAELEAEQEKLIRWHREDGTALDKMRARVTKLKRAAEEIRHLHKDSPMGPCPVCVDGDAMARGDDPTVPYPCPTARLAGAKDCDPPSFRTANPQPNPTAGEAS